ncbi:MAG: peptidoglycan editing factor PgeF, partial [Aquabacterium sp.]|uniref:peptidoglycan editing factor PgeF n=1 Tax=Aquabacterium sp. TaxID=1872578 RepID=UPI001213C908
SQSPYAHCNLGDHVQDVPQAVAHNREAFAAQLQARPAWLTQVHGNRVIRLTHGTSRGDMFNPADQLMAGAHLQPEADGAITTEPGLACTVMVADCLPLLLAAPEGRGVGALHAGWRGLAGAGAMAGRGIVHTGVAALCEAASCEPADLVVWLGPCIGPQHFEVGADVLIGFGVDPDSAVPHPRFKPCQPNVGSSRAGLAPGTVAVSPPKWLADLPGLARDILQGCGVMRVSGGNWCTVSDASKFFSFRRDGVTGRQAAGICLRA